MKTDQYGNPRHPGEAYRAFKDHVRAMKQPGQMTWKKLQREFRRKKRKRKISRLMRKGKHPRRTMRPSPM